MAETTLDPGFKHEVANQPGGENIRRCFTCGTCTAGCPVRGVDEKFNPRKIIRMVLLGMKEKVLSSEIIWLCHMCYTCSFHCPQDVQFVNVMGVLREMAVKERYVSPSFLKGVEAIEKFSQTIRHHMVLSVVDRKAEELIVDPRELLNQIEDSL